MYSIYWLALIVTKAFILVVVFVVVAVNFMN